MRQRGGWPGAEAANVETGVAPAALRPAEVLQTGMSREVVDGSRDGDDSVKSVLGSSSGRDSSESGADKGRVTRARLKSSALASRVSQHANAERTQERTGRLGMAVNPFGEDRRALGTGERSFPRGERLPGQRFRLLRG
jgi:hypothetical protein